MGAYGEDIRYRDITLEMPTRRPSRELAMSLFGRKKPAAPAREYESWDPAVLADAKASEDGAVPASGRSRTGAQHLQAATDALDAKAKRDA